ncbi:MAG: cytochrome c family protein [Alphaproteobacteria bacterium]|nr:cytochrome c family protein [Alphaproteobacteria bacterium]
MSFTVTVPVLIAVALVGILAAEGAEAAGDPAKGKQQFSKCSICHSTEAGDDKVGPSLAGIVGRKSASDEKFAYSAAMKSFNQTWDEKTLDIYLTNPRQTVPGTKMVYPGLKNQSDRDDLIAYLATLK